MNEHDDTGLDNDKALQLARDAYTGSTNYFDGNVRTRI